MRWKRNNQTSQKEMNAQKPSKHQTQNHRNPRGIEKHKATLLQLALWVNKSISAFYTVILGEMDPEVVKLVNLAQIWTFRPLKGS